MVKLKLILFFTLSILFNAQSQETFQRIYLFEDTCALFHDIYCTDSCYYFGATAGKGYRGDIVFGKLELNGEVDFFVKDVTPNEFNQAYGGRTELDTNFRGNFMFGYTNRIFGLGVFPQITEVDINGNIISDVTLDQFYADSLQFYDYGKIQVSNSDSSYYAFFTYYDWTTDSDPGINSVTMDGENGVMLAKVNMNGDTLWTKRFHNPQTNYFKPSYAVGDFNHYGDDKFIFSIVEGVYYSGWVEDLTWAKIHFFIVDFNGNELDHFTFEDTQNTYIGFGNLPLEDGGVIHSYYDTQLFGSPPNDQFKYRAVISRLNSDFQQLWKDTLTTPWTNLNFQNTPMKLRLVNDSVFAGAYSHSYAVMYDSTIWNSLRATQSVRVFNRNLDGTPIWNRDYVYWAISDSINEPEYEMWDFEITADGGYITCGNVKNFDILNTGAPGQFGYVLKTNCLGFLGDPQAEFGYSVNDTEVTFVNESIQSGSYTWVFGDGDTLRTSEYIDTVIHTYATNGNYTVQLIAYGCNEINDTILSTITISKDSIGDSEDSIGYAGDGTLLTLFPNPITSGESLAFYVGAIPEGNTIVEISNEIGEIAFKGSIYGNNTTYIIPVHFAVGVYFVSLLNNDKRLEVEKLVVR